MHGVCIVLQWMIFCDYCDFFVGTIIHITLDTSLPFGRPLSVRFAHQRLCSQKLRISCCFKATLRHSPIASLCLPLALQAIPLLHQLLPWETMDPNPTWDHGISAGWDRYIRCSLENSWDSLEIFCQKKNPDLVSKSQVLQIGSHLY